MSASRWPGQARPGPQTPPPEGVGLGDPFPPPAEFPARGWVRSLEPLQQYLTTYRDMLDLVTLDKVSSETGVVGAKPAMMRMSFVSQGNANVMLH